MLLYKKVKKITEALCRDSYYQIIDIESVCKRAETLESIGFELNWKGNTIISIFTLKPTPKLKLNNIWS